LAESEIRYPGNRLRALAELHCHTRFSDGFATPQVCIRAARARRLSILAITDHNTAEGGLPYWDRPVQDGVLVIPGEEISTELGHVLALFVRETIQPGEFLPVVENVHAQGGLAFLAHPYHIPIGNIFRRKTIMKLTAQQLESLDGLEVENGHNRWRANRLAPPLAARHSRVAISGSDAHFPWEVGNACTAIELAELSLQAVRLALLNGRAMPLPRRFSAFPIYLLSGLLNRVQSRQYAWKG